MCHHFYYVFLPLHPTEFNNSLPELLCSDDDSGNEDVLDMEYTETEAENLKRNAEVNTTCPEAPQTVVHKSNLTGVLIATLLEMIDLEILSCPEWRPAQLLQTHQCRQSHREQLLLWLV